MKLVLLALFSKAISLFPKRMSFGGQNLIKKPKLVRIK